MRFRGSTLKTYLTRIFLVSLIVAFLLPFLITQAQCEISYIVVHAVNPEGIEIASIEGMNLYSVPIFDGDKLIGFSGHDAETTNRVIKISPGTHTIRAIFNGITKEQTVTLIPNEIRTITFTFDRNNFDLAGYFDSIGGSFVDISQEATWVTGDNQWVDEISPDPFNAGIWLWVEAWKLNQERPMTFSWKANGESNIILNSTQFKIRTKAKVEITDKANCEGSIRVSAFLDNYELGFSCGLSSTTDFTRWFVQYIQDGWWPRVFLQNSLFMWGIMTGYRGLPDGTQVPDEGYHFVTLPAYIDYTDISFFLYRDYSKEWIYWNHRVGVSAWVDGVGSDSDELSYEGKLHNLKCSSIPYDITGKGIKAGEGNPPDPSSALTLSVPCGIKVHVAGSTSPYAVYGGNVAPQDINMAFDIASSPERHGYRFLGSATSTQEFYGSFVWYLVVATGGVNVDAFEFLGTSRFWEGGTGFFSTGESSTYSHCLGPPDGRYSHFGFVILSGVKGVIRPVLLVPGWHGVSENWDIIKEWLEKDGYSIEILKYDDSLSFVSAASVLSKKVEEMLSRYHVRKIDIIAHSFGGLVSRYYIEELDGDKNVDNLIMIATPNHGSPLADILTGVTEKEECLLRAVLSFFSYFRADRNWDSSKDLRTENNNYNLFLLNFRFRSEEVETKYFTIAGTDHYPFDFSSAILEGPDDGVVQVDSVKLNGVPLYCVELNHSSIVNPYRVKEYHSEELSYALSKLRFMYTDIIRPILEDSPPSVQDSCLNMGDPADNFLLSCVGSFRIKVGDLLTKEFYVDEETSKIGVAFYHYFSDFNFTLITPLGEIINAQTAKEDPSINYYSDVYCAYTVKNPVSGIWKVIIEALDVPEEGEDIEIYFLSKKQGALMSGDLDSDADVDQNDLNFLLTYRSQPASACPECDIDGDGVITVLDARKLVLMCTRPRCATE